MSLNLNLNLCNMWPLIKSVSLILILSYIGFAALITFFQSRFIFYPDNELHASPEVRGLHFEDVFIETSDNIKIHGWYIPSPNSRKTLLFFHGNAGNISHRLESIEIFHNLNLNVLIIDYRAYGKSEGSISEKGTYLDAQAAWDFLINDKKLKSEDIILFGRSLGGAVASYLAVKNNASSIIIESSFVSVNEIAKDIYFFLPISLLSRFKYNTLKYIESLKCPKLIIHSPDDEIIPFKHGKKLFEKAPDPKIFLKITGCHNYGFMNSKKQYIEGLKKFLSNL
ncbi:MAG: alpha/beta hydrolase [Pseudomonadota bacterium]